MFLLDILQVVNHGERNGLDKKITKNMKYTTHDWKGYFINDLISDLNYKYYLELGVSVGESWKLISCENKIGVDSNINVANEFDSVLHSTTDDFFLKNNNKFDLIYIDALHEKNQVYKDFKNSFYALNDSGIIIFHDINPIDISQTHFNSSGDIFELWIEISKIYKVYTFVGGGIAASGDSVGIFIKSENPTFIDFEIKDYTYEYFSKNRENILSYSKYEEIINKFKK